jgi:hypothetical protein
MEILVGERCVGRAGDATRVTNGTELASFA